MTILRLTQKAAKDFKISNLQDPVPSLSVFDDWAVDVLRICRKKVAMVTHAKSKLTFFLPYSASKGIAELNNKIFTHLSYFMKNHEIPNQDDHIQKLATSEITACKTNDRRLLGHMNDFKRCLEGYIYGLEFAQIDWNEVIIRINQTPINVKDMGGYVYPSELMLRLVSSSLYCH